MPTILTFDNINELYGPDEYILLMPNVSRHLLTITPMWSLDVATLKIDPDNTKEVHKIDGSSDSLGLTKVALDKIATAADVSVTNWRMDDMHDRMHAVFAGKAVMETPSGGRRDVTKTAEWDGQAMSELRRREAHAYVNKMVEAGKKVETPAGWMPAAELNDGQFADTVEYRFQGQWIREQIYGKRKAETSAATRALRSLLGIQGSYKAADLAAKSFAIIRFVFTPPVDDDPEIKKMVIALTMQARGQLYPGALPFEPANTSPTPAMLPAQNTPAPLSLPPGGTGDEQVAPEPPAFGGSTDPEPDPIVVKIAEMREGMKRLPDDLLANLRAQLNKMETAADTEGLTEMYDWMDSSGYLEGAGS